MKVRIPTEELIKVFPELSERRGDSYVFNKAEKIDEFRTISQNSAIHLYLTLLSKALNEAGLDMKTVLKPTVDISWTTENTKTYLWKPIQKALFGSTSTTKLKKVGDIELIHDHINRLLAENPKTQGLEFIPFPCLEELNKRLKKLSYPQNDLGEEKF